MKITYCQITPQNINSFREVMIPGVYKELLQQEEPYVNRYFAIGAKAEGETAGALVADHSEITGDLLILSLFVKRAYQGRDIGSGLLKKLVDLAYVSYDRGPGEYGVDIFVKMMYSLPDDIREGLEQFLKKNEFTDFYVFEKGRDGKPDTRGASAQVHFMYSPEETEETLDQQV